MSVYIGNLPYEVERDELSKVFADYGSVKRVHLPTDRETGKPRGFAFVDMGSDAEEEAAIAAFDGAEWMGRTDCESIRPSRAKTTGVPLANRKTASPVVSRAGIPSLGNASQFVIILVGGNDLHFHPFRYGKGIKATDP